MLGKEKISVIVPAYNEEGNILKALTSIRRVLPEAEIIVVDDGSKDNTVARAKSFNDPLVKVFPLPHKGKGHAIIKAIDAASGDLVAQIDADLQFPAEELPLLLKPILENKADIVFGSRYLPSSLVEKSSISLVKRLASHLIARFISLILRQRYTDVFAGFKAWKNDAARNLNIKEKGFAYEAELAIKGRRKGYTIAEIPISYKRRVSGQSKISFLYHLLNIPWCLIRLVLFAK